MKKNYLFYFLTTGIIFFLYLPIIVLVFNSFSESRFGGTWTGFSLKWYKKLFSEHAIWIALYNSLLVATIATLVSTVLGTLAALSLHRYPTFLQKVHYGLIYLPFTIPDILVGISLLLFFVSVGIKLGLVTVCIAHITFCISYVTKIILTRLQQFDKTLIEAAYDLGASPWYAFRKIMVPHLMPAIISSALLAFTLSIDDFVITFFVVGPGITTLPIRVYSMIKFGSLPLINAISTILLFATFCIIWLTHHITEKQR